ncbi:MAG: acetylglutamate kinase [Chloroflexi bacterium]|nr:acetylglutamate kinase [Chloroflexota bacterium]
MKDGIRITDEKSLEMVAAVLGGLVNSDLVAAINALGGKAFGMTGIDGNLLECRIENPEMGFAGKIVRVNPKAVQAVLDAGFIPMIAPPGAKAPDEKSAVPYININGDDIAGELAAVLGAQTVIFLTDVDGIRGADGKVMPNLTAGEVKSLMASGVIKGGMIPKAKGALAALEKAPTVQIVDGRVPHALVSAVDGKGVGTVIR